MKNISFIFIILIIFFSSCKEDTIVDIDIYPTDTILKSNDTIVFNYTLIPDVGNGGKIGSLQIKDSQGKVIKSENISSVENYTDTCQYIVPSAQETLTDIVVFFAATDENSGLENVKSATITIFAGIPILFTFESVQAFFDVTDIESSFIIDFDETQATSENGTYTDGELAFVWTENDGYSILSPNAIGISDVFSSSGVDYNTSDKHETKIMSYDGNWEDLDDEAINDLQISTETSNLGGNGVDNLTEENILIFETEAGRKGALKITTLIKDTKYISMNIKFQQLNT